MSHLMVASALAITAAASLLGIDARKEASAHPALVTQTDAGKPILLGRMVVTATALPQDR